jgi:hypothetical protein
MAGLNMALAANAQAGILGQLASGTVPPQTSGSALNGLIDVGGAADATLIRLIQLFWTQRAERRLRLRLYFGGMMGRSGQRGVIPVPNRSQYSSTPVYRVTPAMIKRTGTYLEVEAFNWRPDVTVAQYLSTLRNPSPVTGMPLIADETALRLLKSTPDVDRERERMEDEQLMAQPPIARQRQLRRLKRERDQAAEEGDDESVDDAQTAILQLEFIAEQEVLQGMAAPGTASGMQQMQMPMPETGGGPVIPGTSLPEQGIDVGHEGARPTGSVQAMTPVGGGEGGY